MTDNPTFNPPYSAIWHAAGRCLGASDPLAVLEAGNAAAAARLPQQLANLLRPGQQAVGLVSYPADDLPGQPPLAVVQIFDSSSIREIPANRCGEAPGSDGDTCNGFTCDGFTCDEFALRSAFRSEMAIADYLAALQRIHQYLRAGDCYQVNFAHRFSASFSGDPLVAWHRLHQQHPAPHGSFFRLQNGDCVFGVSPERLLKIENRQIVTEPIKGSRPRGADEQQDRALGDSLLHSAKDRAENLMIVDLLRNDLGKVCVPGSVKAEPLFELRKFSNVQHLVSTISGTLREDISPLAALLSCFPGGSVTGAPKKRAMEIIAELEPVPRGFYCGSQFSLDSEGNLESNILIRTFQTQGEQIYCHGGGGIVIDSDPVQEYQETLFKIEKLMTALL